MKYAYVTTISTFKLRYVVPEDKLKQLNAEHNATDAELVDRLKDQVTMENVEQFSQFHVGEQIIEIEGGILTEDEMLELFDRENDYLADWDREKKIELVRNF